jgi:signal peptidase I
LRDVYYRAVEPVDPYWNTEYDTTVVGYKFDVAGLMANPQGWSTTPLFNARRSVTFSLDADQFFPLGDNSPESRDARVWSERQYATDMMWPPPYVKRDLLIGKALLIYWPHSWRLMSDWLPIIPNFQRVGAIR